MSEEKWTPVDGYEICEDGRILSHLSNWRGLGSREINWSSDGTGYAIVRMVNEKGERKKFKVHQLVCRCFHGEKPSKLHEVRHLDGNKMNNCAENLAWGTRSENALDRVRHGRQHKNDWSDSVFRDKAIKGMIGSKQRKALAKARGEK